MEFSKGFQVWGLGGKGFLKFRRVPGKEGNFHENFLKAVSSLSLLLLSRQLQLYCLPGTVEFGIQGLGFAA